MNSDILQLLQQARQARPQNGGIDQLAAQVRAQQPAEPGCQCEARASAEPRATAPPCSTKWTSLQVTPARLHVMSAAPWQQAGSARLLSMPSCCCCMGLVCFTLQHVSAAVPTEA